MAALSVSECGASVLSRSQSWGQATDDDDGDEDEERGVQIKRKRAGSLSAVSEATSA